MRRIFAAAAALFLLISCAVERRLVIVSTNDIHSSIDNFPRLATLVEHLRVESGGEVLLLDAGDRWTGNPFVDLAERPLSPIVELMNELGYDAATLGNHEFDWGQALLGERIGEMDFPVVCANVKSDGAVLGAIPPYVIIERGGVRVALLGLVANFTPWGRPEGKAEHFEGLSYPDVFETAKRYAGLRDSCDLFVALTHIGFERDKQLAEALPTLDLVVGGDSHTLLSESTKIGGTLVTQTGSGLKYAGITTVTRKGDELTVENRLARLDTIPPMEYFSNMVDRYNASPELHASIGEVASPLDGRGVDNLVTDALRAAAGADLSLYHSGGIRIDTLAGGVSTADLYRIDPFMSEVYTLRMSPGQIKGLILGTFNSDSKEGHRADIMPGGFGYHITTDEAGEAVEVILTAPNGSPMPERESYLVAMPDYLYKNYRFERTEDAAQTDIAVTDALRDHIVGRTPLEPDNEPRVVIK
ncbi:MAG: bifunctional metallophosphatase/5'-nucleotidase [Alistipes sp.]|jgi:5'-nucleotidase|nr:bifunctional metallophosphatase/5'-nucleotidase [Alistipes sp.]